MPTVHFARGGFNRQGWVGEEALAIALFSVLAQPDPRAAILLALAAAAIAAVVVTAPHAWAMSLWIEAAAVAVILFDAARMTPGVGVAMQSPTALKQKRIARAKAKQQKALLDLQDAAQGRPTS